MELLAPAKDKQTAIAAIDCGADAVYIGAPAFGARKNASNSLEDINEVVDYAHKFYARVYVTLNTILTDEELQTAAQLIHKLYEIGADAIIIQDMGILELAIQGKLPTIPLHASTQCDNRTPEKVKFFKDVGLTRVILARELSLEQIAAMPKGIELEAFIHGALCVCYSGQCYLSCAIGGRSANRGECAQPCRKKYTLVDEDKNIIAKDKHLLNLKDLNASKHLKALQKAGVTSFKIEGRLKDENYVKNAVLYYSGHPEADITKTFNRGFTDYFSGSDIYNFDTPKFVGEKLTTKPHPKDGLCCFENGELRGGTGSGQVYRNFDFEYNKKLTNLKPKRQIGVKFILENYTLTAIDENDNHAQIPVSCEPPKTPEKMLETFLKQLKKTGDSDFHCLDVQINSEVPFMPVSAVNELRRSVLDALMAERLKNYPRKTQKPLKYAKFPVKKLDYRANIHNSAAQAFYEKCGCEVSERSLESTIRHSERSEESLCNKELMRTKHCLKRAFGMCKSPKKADCELRLKGGGKPTPATPLMASNQALFLIDDRGQKYRLEYDCANCEQLIFLCH